METAGPVDTPDSSSDPAPGIPLALIHGAGAVGQIWQNQLLAFPRAVAPDLPGHPSGPGLSTIPDMARWLLEYLDARPREEGPWVVGGHSMGGAVAIEAVLTDPPRFRGLILIATGRLRVRQEFMDLLARDYAAAVEELLRWWFTPAAPPRVVARARTALQAVSPAVVHDDFWAAHRYDAMERVAAIALPTAIICGEEDRMTPVKYSEYLHRQIAGSRLTVIPRAGHLVILERPRAVNAAVAAFLRSL